MDFITGENDKDRRLDRILRKAMPEHSLALIHRLLRQGKVLVNGKPAKAQDRIGVTVKISIPSLNDTLNPSIKVLTHTQNTPISLDIIWEDRGLIAVNKPAGIAVHGQNSLDTCVQSFLAGKTTPSLSFKPGPLHRLDKPSSGIIIFSVNIEGARLFTSLIKEKKVQKIYLAIVMGTIKNEEIWQDILIRDKEKKKTYVENQSHQGKTAITKVTPLAAKNNFSLIQAEIITGRTHQIRAQASFHGYPLLGDVKYGGQKAKTGEQKVDLFLHALKLEFLEYSIEAPLPIVFKQRVKELFGIIMT